ncbi:isoaspartyl peptidase/L-asparaginase-like [Stylophora pistillata]|uniref:isoaspartyl peptidase/L-asparaginase-like n=1 Tax=Stylophora pistillata TaxID=50429 RepID=UPI000C05658C|nr:isoaspartyl peptidase/L-asparaginase-like [Stylophora pistillata]
MEPCIIIHGGCRPIPAEFKEPYKQGVQLAARKGYAVLLEGGSALEAVEEAVRNMEDNPLFNAGRGCALTEENTAELDALIMDGHNLAAGAVACVRGIANPVSLARRVMEDTPHCLLAGEGALKFAKKIGFPVVEDPLVLITAESYDRSANAANYVETVEDYNAGNLKQTDSAGSSQGFDTVGAVAFDSHGQLASATSTGVFPISCVIVEPTQWK